MFDGVIFNVLKHIIYKLTQIAWLSIEIELMDVESSGMSKVTRIPVNTCALI